MRPSRRRREAASGAYFETERRQQVQLAELVARHEELDDVADASVDALTGFADGLALRDAPVASVDHGRETVAALTIRAQSAAVGRSLRWNIGFDAFFPLRTLWSFSTAVSTTKCVFSTSLRSGGELLGRSRIE